MQNQTGENASQVALNYIRSFKNGVDFTPPSAGIIIKGRPDIHALNTLKEHLVTENGDVRENIVNLIVDVGTRSDTLLSRGAEVIRDPNIIRILATEGLIKPDIGRERSMDALRKLVLESDLTRFGDNFVKALKDKPSDETLLLIAKAKTTKAKENLNKLAQTDEWKQVEAVKIAQAALGDDAIAAKYINDLKEANAENDALKFEQIIGSLSLIGTTGVLKLIAEHLRTPLIIDRPHLYKKSARLSVLEALLYNFPDQVVLYPNNINSDADYAAAEKFCTHKFGVVYTTPRPPFMTYFGYPMPMPMPNKN